MGAPVSVGAEVLDDSPALVCRLRPGAPRALRLKRGRADAAPHFVTVELAPAPKRLRALSLDPVRPGAQHISSGDGSGVVGGHQGRGHKVRFRRLDLVRSGPRHVIAKAHVVDVLAERLRDFPLALRAAEQEKRNAREKQMPVEKQMQRESFGEQQQESYIASVHNLRPREGLDERQRQEEFTCNGELMVRQPVEAEVAAAKALDKDLFVYDIYLREDVEAEEVDKEGKPTSEILEVDQLDQRPLVAPPSPLEHAPGSASEHGDMASNRFWSEAFLSAADVPGIEFWDGPGDSSDELLGDGCEDDGESSEGSVDYPSTPDEDAYVREVVSGGDEDDEIVDETRTEYGEGAFPSDSEDADSNKAVWQPSSSTTFGYRIHGSDRDSLSAPEDYGFAPHGSDDSSGMSD
jgi:hypothetical protein